MPVDGYWAFAAVSGWTFAGIMCAYALGQAKQLHTAREQLASFALFDRDHDGKPGGSLAR